MGLTGCLGGEDLSDTSTETSAETRIPEDKRVFAYFPGWTRNTKQRYNPADVPFDKVTDVIYSFLDVRSDGTVQLPEANKMVHKKTLSEFGSMAADLDTNLLLSIGGWSLSDDFPSAAKTHDRRHRFAETAVELLRKYNFDGIDIDWEHPGEGGNDGRSDPEKHVQLLTACRERLNAAGAEDGRDYTLSIAASASRRAGADLHHATIANHCDYVHLMAYDMTGTWARRTGLNAPLFENDYDTHSGGDSQHTVQEGVNMWLDNGVSPGDLTLGLPFYGRGFANVPDENRGLFQTFSGVPEGSLNGVFPYMQLQESQIHNDTYERHWHEEAAVPWLYSADESVMISYDDAESIAAKVTFACDNDLGGVMIWELSQDHNETLLNAIIESL